MPSDTPAGIPGWSYEHQDYRYRREEPKRMKVYLIGSLRNPDVPALANRLRAAFPQHEIFDDWYSAGHEADDMWRDYEKGKGNDFQAALQGHAAKHVFEFDKKHLDSCDAAVLVLPAGKSGHLELGYVAGKGKPTAILLDSDPDRFDVMYKFADRVVKNEGELMEWLGEKIDHPPTPLERILAYAATLPPL